MTESLWQTERIKDLEALVDALSTENKRLTTDIQRLAAGYSVAAALCTQCNACCGKGRAWT